MARLGRRDRRTQACESKSVFFPTRVVRQIQARQGKINMRRVTGIFVVLAAALPSASQDAPGKNRLPNYYPLKAGTKWIYEADEGNGQKTQVTNRIAEIESIDGQALARLENVIDGNVASTEHLASTPKGVFRHRAKGVEVNPPVCILKYPFDAPRGAGAHLVY